MNSKYYEFKTKEEKKQIEKELIKKGYILSSDLQVSFEDIKKFYPRNKIFLVHAFYNSINKKYEYVFTTKQVEKSYPTIKKIIISKL